MNLKVNFFSSIIFTASMFGTRPAWALDCNNTRVQKLLLGARCEEDGESGVWLRSSLKAEDSRIRAAFAKALEGANEQLFFGKDDRVKIRLGDGKIDMGKNPSEFAFVNFNSGNGQVEVDVRRPFRMRYDSGVIRRGYVSNKLIGKLVLEIHDWRARFNIPKATMPLIMGASDHGIRTRLNAHNDGLRYGVPIAVWGGVAGLTLATGGAAAPAVGYGMVGGAHILGQSLSLEAKGKKDRGFYLEVLDSGLAKSYAHGKKDRYLSEKFLEIDYRLDASIEDGELIYHLSPRDLG